MTEFSLERMGTFAGEALVEMLQAMLGIADAEVSSPRIVRAACADTALSAFIGIAGPWAGGVAVHGSAQLARTLAAKMLMMDDASSLSEDDVRDAMGEICNMVAGGLKTRCQAIGMDFDITVPLVVLSSEPTHVHYRMVSALCVVGTKLDSEMLELRISMAPGDRVPT